MRVCTRRSWCDSPTRSGREPHWLQALAGGTELAVPWWVTKLTIPGLLLAAALPLAGALLPGCGAGDVNNNGGGDAGADLDPNNPPPTPFPENPFPEDGTCGDINAVVDGLTPTVQLLIDQSGSMDADFGNSDRWDSVYSTLMGNDGVVGGLQSTIRFGLSLYTSDGGDAGGTCPMLTSVNANLDNFGAIDAVYGGANPQGDTPTGESIDAVVDQLLANPNPGRKVIVLGTDGEPDSCAVPNPENEQEALQAQQISLDAAKRAFDAGIRVYIVSVGNQVGEQHLQDMANAGSGLEVGGADNAEYFVALNPQDLVDAFGTIVGGVAGCIFTINGQVDPAKASQGLVALDGNELEYNTDWVMLDGKTFEVLGDSCEIIKDGSLHHISAAFPCGTIVIE